jgi:acetyltransferase-like isoleucine patch superfamily enzyme
MPILDMMTVGLLPGWLKKLFYRFRGARIGAHVRIGPGAVLKAESIEIGDHTRIGPLCVVQAKRIRLGRRVEIGMLTAIKTGVLEIGDDSVIHPQVAVGGTPTPRSALRIGERSQVLPYCFVNTTEPVTIGDETAIGGRTNIFTHASAGSALDGFPVVNGPVTIGSKVWIAWNVFVQPAVTIHDYSLVAGASVVSSDIPEGSLVSGFPAKVAVANKEYLRKPSPQRRRKIVEGVLTSLREYVLYQGRKADLVREDPCVRLAFEPAGGGMTTVLLADEAAAAEGTGRAWDVLISMGGVPDRMREDLAARGKVFFDVENLVTRYSGHPAWNEIRGFFGRSGIRFKVLG